MNTRTRRQQQLVYIFIDLISALVIWLAFLVFRWMAYEGRIFGVDEILVPAFNFYPPLFLYPLGCMLVYYASGYYMNPFRKRLTAEFVTTLCSALLISLVAFFIIIINDEVDSYQRYLYSFSVLLCLQFFISYVPRLIVTLVCRRQASNGRWAQRTLVVGEGAKVRQVLDEISSHPSDYRLIAHISETQLLDDVSKYCEGVDTVILACDDSTPEQKLYGIINRIYPLGIEICYTPRLFDVLTGTVRIDRLDASPIVNITDNKAPDYVLSIKRLFDIFSSTLALLLLSPLLLVIALIIKLSSDGPVFYSQERIGHYGRKFNIYKFRTMIDHAETVQPLLTTTDDPRITPVGKWLRQYRLDELPQLWNVLRGDMSIVGPRPEREFFIKQIMQKAPYYCLIYKLRPGLTSWGPIKVGYTDTIEKMIQRTNYDIIYMENLSLRLDIKIMLYTITVILKGKGQ